MAQARQVIADLLRIKTAPAKTWWLSPVDLWWFNGGLMVVYREIYGKYGDLWAMTSGELT